MTNRVVSQDIADFEAAMTAAKAAEGHQEETLLSRLAEQAMRTAVEPERSRARARFELMMMSQRDPELATVFHNLMDRFVAIGEEAVAQLQPHNAAVDTTLVKAQAFAVITFLGGFLFRLANGIAGSHSAQELERYLHAVIAGVAAEHTAASNYLADFQPDARGTTNTRPSTPAPRTRSNASSIRSSCSVRPITAPGSTAPVENASITSRNSLGR